MTIEEISEGGELRGYILNFDKDISYTTSSTAISDVKGYVNKNKVDKE